jgi:hypothetical protein
MVIKTQESCNDLESYLKTFDITKFPGKKFPIVFLHLKAVAKALGNDDLPTKVICKVLEGFSKSSTKSFNEVCASQIAFCRGGFYSKILKATSLHVQLIDLLTDLKNACLELIGSNLREGVGHPGMAQGASFKAVTSEPPNEHQAMAAIKNLPWDEWVKKYAKCAHCGEIGHIRPKCRKYLAQTESGEIKHPKKVRHDLQ